MVTLGHLDDSSRVENDGRSIYRHSRCRRSFRRPVTRANGREQAPGPQRLRQPASPWAFNLSVSGYDVPNGQSYVSPTFTADHSTLHLEARYNYEAQQTGSLWAGYNLSKGKTLMVAATPMIGGVFGILNGIAPGLELTVTYKKLQLFSANEYIFDTNDKVRQFFLHVDATDLLASALVCGGIRGATNSHVSHLARYPAWLAGAVHAQKDYVLHAGF